MPVVVMLPATLMTVPLTSTAAAGPVTVTLPPRFTFPWLPDAEMLTLASPPLPAACTVGRGPEVPQETLHPGSVWLKAPALVLAVMLPVTLMVCAAAELPLACKSTSAPMGTPAPGIALLKPLLAPLPFTVMLPVTTIELPALWLSASTSTMAGPLAEDAVRL